MDSHPKILTDLITFYQKLLIPYMEIHRDMPFPGRDRAETDGEHAFTLAMVAISLNERFKLELDAGKIAQYALVHDLVEVHAGDLSVKASDELHASKAEKEHEALQVIEQDFAELFPWVHKSIMAYESRSDQESRFVYITDKLMGALGWLAGEGKGWPEYYPADKPDLYPSVVKRLRKKVASQNDTELLKLFDFVHLELDRQRTNFT